MKGKRAALVVVTLVGALVALFLQPRHPTLVLKDYREGTARLELRNRTKKIIWLPYYGGELPFIGHFASSRYDGRMEKIPPGGTLELEFALPAGEPEKVGLEFYCATLSEYAEYLNNKPMVHFVDLANHPRPRWLEDLTSWWRRKLRWLKTPKRQEVWCKQIVSPVRNP